MIEVIERFYGSIEHLLNGDVHRPNGPAIIDRDGDWEWCLNGTTHRYYGACTRWGDWVIHGKRMKW